ncbi:MAG: hypothetical protein M1608_03630 [Candidatus Omnitrophica bacterium]|nr:hypothetical protein [Candidatus Omnitrophota bacterium]
MISIFNGLLGRIILVDFSLARFYPAFQRFSIWRVSSHVFHFANHFAACLPSSLSDEVKDKVIDKVDEGE